MKRDVPELEMYSVFNGITPPSMAISSNVFGYQPTDANKPATPTSTR
jgi:hypothetical protein